MGAILYREIFTPSPCKTAPTRVVRLFVVGTILHREHFYKIAV
ncbi:hypothetical protein PPEP_a2081 [Pseudoalteromonas peptidolytica F12-50-A1]|uniref:Uncharacterized protein n=1 Tax=Pseudoalteromonas peptidolytica F12-50-A1 TaxID=1315280 RepID=A0A8I0MZ03_9GAMM|nr:hypothetical protein [Pseudoalteromonas peptidolytica F12-50-A1]